jgi:uncharacterized phage-associated protein
VLKCVILCYSVLQISHQNAFIMPNQLSQQQIDKFGNSLIFLSDNVSEFNKTKLLKLLFFIEEKSIAQYGNPFFGIDFKLWQFGPVAESVFYDLSSDKEMKFLNEFIKKNEFDEYEKNKEFIDDEFSNNDVKVLEYIIDFARHKNAGNMVAITHSSNSLWRKTAIKYNVLDFLLNKKDSRTEFNIDFNFLFEDKENYISEKYISAIENIEFSQNFKQLKRV